MQREPAAPRGEDRVTRAARTPVVAVFLVSCGGGAVPASSDAGSGPDCGPNMYISGDTCKPLQFGSDAEAGRRGDGAAEATTEAGGALDGGDGAADASADGGALQDGGDAAADATTVGSPGTELEFAL